MSKMHFIDWIWRARGSVELNPPMSPAQVFEKLDPILDEADVTPNADEGSLTYKKHNPGAQDRLATFSSGKLLVQEEEGQMRLRYDLKSPALRLVFLAPLLFLAIAVGTEILSDHERLKQEQEEAAKGEEEEEEDEEEEPRNPIDVFLGAPEPLTLEEKKQREEEKKDEDKHSAKPAYVFAGIFATLWLLGRFLEPWLVRRTFRRTLFPDQYPEEPMHITARRTIAGWFKKSTVHR